MTYTAAETQHTSSIPRKSVELNRTQHILDARAISRELRLASIRFDGIDVTRLDALTMWDAMQPSAALKVEFTRFLDDLYFEGIRSQFFGDFDADKLILPVANEIADRLDALADELEVQLAKLTPSQVHADAFGERTRDI